jgi:MATE family multidrug resistance protein
MRPRLKTLLVLALPMVLARASQSVITFADVIQVKDLGSGAIAATATGGLNVIGFVILPMGIVFIVQSFVAQLTGRGEREATSRFAWYGLAIALIAGLVAAALIPAVEPVLGLTGYSPHVRHAMAEYMGIRMLSVAAIVGTEALGNWYGGLGKTWMQMIAGVVTMACAVFLNWVLIGGHLGAPAMGVDGAALASTIASWLGFGVIAVAFWRRWGGAPKRTGPLGLNRRELVRVVRFGTPNGLNWFLEFTAFQLFVNIVIAGLGDETVAALNVVIAVNSIAFMPAFGLATAGAILAGQAIGRGDRDGVWPTVKLTLACTMGWMVAIAAAYLLAPERVVGWFAPDGAAAGKLVAVGASMLWISALWQVFDATGLTLAETLRAAGDTTWTAGARIVLAWAVFMPSAWVVVRELDGGPIGAMVCLVVYLALLAVALAWRFRTGAWRTIELLEPKLV